MRWLFLLFVGLIASACGLSFNPDLPSGRDGNESNDDGDYTTGDGDATGGPGDGDISVNPPTEADDATGGAGGAGGATSKR